MYTQIIKNASKASIKPIIQRLVNKKESVLYSDKWKAYDGLVLDGYKHYRINHSKEFADKNNHINGIENFWGWAKHRLAKFRGISRKSFFLYLKESEFRFNFRKNDLYDILIKIIKN